ncbi:MAG: hypothetical protein M1830_003287 [Pleopsidium flavum]|nr:MAG: hypothetical protein M1830_003287 [Pleopsidium flavum]
MSIRPNHTQTKKSTVFSASPPSPRNTDDPDNIDIRLLRLTQRTLPRSPYLLTVPSDKPYHISSHQSGNWRIGSPFNANEESLQYMSFLSRNWEDSLLVAIGGWDDEKGSVMETGTAKTDGVKSSTNTPQNGQVQKKKITLSAYKNKAKAIEGQRAVPKAPEVNSAKNHNPKVNGVSADAGRPALSRTPPENNKKRPLDATSDLKASIPTKQHESQPPPPAKKTRTSSPPAESGPKKSDTASTNPHGLPPLLSPTLPASIEEELAKLPSSPPSLNGKSGHRKTGSLASSCSDTKHLASSRTSSPSLTNSVNSYKKGKTIDSNSKSTDRSLPKTELDAKSDRKAVEAGKRPPTAESKIRSYTPEVGNKSVKINGSAGASSFFEGLKTGNYTSSVVPPTTAPKIEKPELQKKRIVRLKIPKSLRKTVVRILQMKPQPKKIKDLEPKQEKVTEDTKRKSREDNGLKRVEKDRERVRSDGDRATERDKIGSKGEVEVHLRGSAKAAEKRPRTSDDDHTREPPSKRQKPPNGLDLSQKPRTPIPPAFKSPALSQQGSAQKSQISTPKREVKSVAMRRIESGDGDVKTPQGAIRAGTPNAPGSAEKTKPSSTIPSSGSTSNSGRNEDISALRAGHKKYLALGRELKYAADKLLKSKEKDAVVDEASAKQGTAIAFECVLCYMLAFTLADQACHLGRQSSDAGSWRSLLPYWNFVETKCQPYPKFHGLCLQLGAVCRDLIHSHDLDRLNSDALPTAAAEEARPPTPGTEGDAGASEVASKAAAYRKEYMDFKTKLVENARVAQQLWVEGTYRLPIDGLTTAFPQTWAKSAKGPMARARERVVPGKYNGDFYLPLGCMTTGIEAVRAGWSLLGEWCKKEKVQWDGKMGL